MTTNLFALGNIVTQEQLENSFSILWRSSAAFRGMIEDIQLAGDTVSIDVIDATEYPAPTVPGMDPVSYSLTNVDAVGISTVVITEQYLQNIQYKTDYANGTTADVSLERVIAHEMAHAWQHATGVAQDEEQAAELENTIMKTLGEPPREGDPNSTQPTYDDSATFAPAPHPIRLYDPAHPLPPEILSDIQPGAGNAASVSSPLVIDLSATHSGVTLTEWNAATTGTFFDLNENGFAVQTAWVTGDTGLLARDLNANGRIDSTAELFGSPTVDGFAKLAVLDSNHDMRIDANDEAWSTLVVWTDTNGDAVTQEGELHSLASLGIANIDLAGVAASTSTISGNPISHTSTVTFTDGATATVADAWFVHDNTNSYYAEDYTLDAEVLFLPTLRGYGTLPDLSIAMSQDSDLKDMVADFVSNRRRRNH